MHPPIGLRAQSRFWIFKKYTVSPIFNVLHICSGIEIEIFSTLVSLSEAAISELISHSPQRAECGQWWQY